MYYFEETRTSFPTPYDGPNFRPIYIAGGNLYVPMIINSKNSTKPVKIQCFSDSEGRKTCLDFLKVIHMDLLLIFQILK